METSALGYHFIQEKVPRDGYGSIERGIPRVGYNHRSEKVLIKSMNQDPRVFDMDRIQEEFDLMVECEHKNTVKALAMGTDENFYRNMVLEYIDCDLMNFFGQDKVYYRVSRADKIRELQRQLLVGLAWMHERGVAHQNVGFHSLLVRLDYNEFVLKLGDFSCARRIAKTPPVPEILLAGARKISYSAPEVLLMETQKMGTAVDIWSAGVVFAQLLLGFNPFYGINFERGKVADVIRKFLDGEMDKRIQDEVALDLLRGMLAWDPAERLTARQALDSPYFKVKSPPFARENEENKEDKKMEPLKGSMQLWKKLVKIFSFA